MHLPFQSIRWRIQAWHGLILLIAIVAFCATAYQLAWFNQSRRIDREIQRTERKLFRELTDTNQTRVTEVDKKTPKRLPFPEELFQIIQKNNVELTDEVISNFSGTANSYYYFAFANAAGELLLQSDNAPSDLEFLPIPEQTSMLEEFRDRDRFRESVHSFDFGLRSIVGHDIQIELEEKYRFGWSLGASGAALWFVGLLGGWWLAGKAIRPIQSISQTATRIADGNLNQRIDTAGTDSELDQLSHVLNHTFDRLNATLEQQRQFTADASHELRTPLTILLSETQRMRKREIARSTEDYQEAFDLCHDAANRMRRLVESLLLLARQDSESVVQAEIKCDLDKILEDVISLHQPIADTKQVRIECELLSCSLKSSPDLLAVVFNNLIGNAIQHHQGNGLVQVELCNKPDTVTVRIIDDGPGISQEALPRIFDRFYRADSSRSDAHAGHSGLGLALAKSILKNIKANMEVQSKLGQGSTFTITLPRA